VRYGLTEKARIEMACETDHVEYSNGRVVLTTTFQKFQRYLSGRESKGSVETPSKEPKKPVWARGDLVRDLSGLSPSDWAILVASIEGAAANVSHNLPIPEQVAQLVRWAESPTGPELDAIEKTFKSLFQK